MLLLRQLHLREAESDSVVLGYTSTSVMDSMVSLLYSVSGTQALQQRYPNVRIDETDFIEMPQGVLAEINVYHK